MKGWIQIRKKANHKNQADQHKEAGGRELLGAIKNAENAGYCNNLLLRHDQMGVLEMFSQHPSERSYLWFD